MSKGYFRIIYAHAFEPPFEISRRRNLIEPLLQFIDGLPQDLDVRRVGVARLLDDPVGNLSENTGQTLENDAAQFQLSAFL
jgi:hypothetical protein